MKDKIDRTVLGALGGIAGGVAMIAFLQASRILVPLAHLRIFHIAHLFIPPGQDHTVWGNVLAYISHFFISALLGMLFINITRLTGRDWVTTKGLIYGGATWLFIDGMAGKIFNIPQAGNIPIAFAMFLAHLVFGITTAWTIVWLSNRVKL